MIGSRHMKKYTLTFVALLAYFVFGASDLQAREIYAPDGTPRATSAIENQLGFNSSYHDDESNLVYKRARYYSPNQGRFVGRDPAGYVDGQSLYAGYFAAHFGKDPSGLYDFTVDDQKCTVTLNFKMQFFFKDGPKASWTGKAQKRAWMASAETAIESAWSGKRVLVGKAGWSETKYGMGTEWIADPCTGYELPFPKLVSWTVNYTCPCPKGYTVNVDIKTIFEGWDSSDDVEATVTRIPAGAFKVSSANTSIANLDSNDNTSVNKGVAGGQVGIAHEFGHMIGLGHPGGGADGYAEPDGSKSNDIMGSGMVIRSRNLGQWKDALKANNPNCAPYKAK